MLEAYDGLAKARDAAKMFSPDGIVSLETLYMISGMDIQDVASYRADNTPAIFQHDIART